MESMRRTGAALTFFASSLVFAAGCGVFDPGPQFGALAGNWVAWCCDGLLDAGGHKLDKLGSRCALRSLAKMQYF